MPDIDQMFALVRDLAAGRNVSEIAIDPSVVQRHLLAPLAARAGLIGFRDDLVRATAAWARIERDLPPLVRSLTERGVRVTPIKGVAYAKHVYALPAERPMTDVDLLVPPRDEPLARRILGELGFTCDVQAPMHHASAWVRGNLVIDLHRGVIGTGRSRIVADEVWERVVPGWPAGASRLDPADELVFHLVHMARNRLCGPLVQVVDAARLLDRTDAKLALARARAWGIDALVRTALRYCREILDGAPQPGGWLRPAARDVLAVRQPSLARKLVFDVATAGSLAQLAARAVGYIAIRIPNSSS